MIGIFVMILGFLVLHTMMNTNFLASFMSDMTVFSIQNQLETWWLVIVVCIILLGLVAMKEE